MNHVDVEMECTDQRMDFDVVAAIASKDGALIRVHVAARAGHTIDGLYKFSSMFFNIQGHTLDELQQQDAKEQAVINAGPKRVLQFDSYGFIYGVDGYHRALKDPESWEAHWYGDCWLLHDAWVIKAQQQGVEDTTEFRRTSGRPLTHKELND